MEGRIRRRGKNSWELTIDVGRDAGGNRKRADADRKLRELLISLDKGMPLDLSKATLGEFLEQWLADYVTGNTSPSTAAGYETIIRCHLEPALR